jgi:hypothetical protein
MLEALLASESRVHRLNHVRGSSAMSRYVICLAYHTQSLIREGRRISDVVCFFWEGLDSIWCRQYRGFFGILFDFRFRGS